MNRFSDSSVEVALISWVKMEVVRLFLWLCTMDLAVE